PTPAATGRFGRELGSRLRSGHVVSLIGDLGAGKTTMAQAIAAGMGIAAHVTSPTFGLIHEYSGPVPLFHFDTYRLERPQDLADLGFHEYLERGGVVVIEWADRFPELLPAERLTLRMEIDPSDSSGEWETGAPRRLTIEPIGPGYSA